MPVEEWESRETSEDIISLGTLIKLLWDNRKTLYKYLSIGIVIGLFVAIMSPKEYQSQATLLPEVQSSESGASRLLQQYGGILGINAGSATSTETMISPILYPQIVQSLPFQLELLNTNISFPRFDTTTTVFNYFDEIYKPSILSYVRGYTIGLPGKIVGLFKSEGGTQQPLPNEFKADSIISVTEHQMEIIENLRSRISISFNDEIGVINLNVRMPDPNAAASLANLSIDLIREYVTRYRTRKAQEDLEFAQIQKSNAREEFEQAQNKLSEFRDNNINLATAKAQSQEQRLQSEYDLAFNVYNTLAQQVEQAKLKLQEQTPVVRILQPVQVPVNDDTSGLRILILISLISTLIGIGWIFIQYFLLNNSSLEE
ncbi:hypothetical protein G3570_04690 [Balneolaceae bacterium YR4-1]|uniref:Polysaccharide chain length determinant N-terminal domain-containing protein n=1 Tax=Halalkalibaculum roseum TaxID=2709311 RepID=A0A6M1SLP5_9BACT|nr:hypothetical protein [Halalkalibaculum roseum]